MYLVAGNWYAQRHCIKGIWFGRKLPLLLPLLMPKMYCFAFCAVQKPLPNINVWDILFLNLICSLGPGCGYTFCSKACSQSGKHKLECPYLKKINDSCSIHSLLQMLFIDLLYTCWGWILQIWSWFSELSLTASKIKKDLRTFYNSLLISSILALLRLFDCLT